MHQELSKSDQLLLLVYDSSQKVIHHADEIKVKLTGFYLTIAGVAAAGLAILIQGDTGGNDSLTAPRNLIISLVILVGLLGAPVVLMFANLTKTQTHHLKSIEGVFGKIFGSDEMEFQVFIPEPNKLHFHWARILSLVSATVLSYGLHIAININLGNIVLSGTITAVIGLLFLFVMLWIYNWKSRELP